MSGVLVIEMNDDAVAALGVLTGQLPLYLPGKLTPGLELIVGNGIVRRGDVLVWTESFGQAPAAPGEHRDLNSGVANGEGIFNRPIVFDRSALRQNAAQRVL